MCRYEAEFRIWRAKLAAGFSLLCYGWGSKRGLLELFDKRLTRQGHLTLQCYGYRKALTVDVLIRRAAGDLLRLPAEEIEGMPLGDILTAVHQPEVALGRVLYIVLHNVDGPGMRSREQQELLADFVSSPHVRLIASCDHALTPELWDRQ